MSSITLRALGLASVLLLNPLAAQVAAVLEQDHAVAVDSGYWPLYRFDPRLKAEGKNPLQLDSKAPDLPLKEFVYKEARYNMLKHAEPELAEQLLVDAERDALRRWEQYEDLAKAPAEHFGAAPASTNGSEKG